jgi:hypothetical protein
LDFAAERFDASAAFLFPRCAMRAVPLMKAEVAGVVVLRPGELNVLVRDPAGRAVVSHMRPQLLPGEVLRERAGQIPIIEQEAACQMFR